MTYLLEHGSTEAAAYKEQLDKVKMVSRCDCGCPTIDFAVGSRSALPGSPTTILADALAVSPEGVKCGIILHAREGLISELEVYPLYEGRSFTLPEIRQIEFYE